ncbi:hypothetical protein M8C21_005937, partial [Ambrosia artemisiifolia]
FLHDFIPLSLTFSLEITANKSRPDDWLVFHTDLRYGYKNDFPMIVGDENDKAGPDLVGVFNGDDEVYVAARRIFGGGGAVLDSRLWIFSGGGFLV